MTLHVRTAGAGPDLVLLHGWGLHGGIWDPMVRALSTQWRLTVPDLPGHGRSPLHEGGYSLPRLADAVATILPPHCHLLGWSLGGMIALELAYRHPERIGRLVLVGATAQFFASAEWPWALAPGILEDFARRLRADPEHTLRRFLALQVHGAEHARPTLAHLKACIAENRADPRALRGGIDILRSASLLSRLGELRMPGVLIHGERDRLTPQAAARALEERLAQAVRHVIAGAGHAPFLSHPRAFLSALRAGLE